MLKDIQFSMMKHHLIIKAGPGLVFKIRSRSDTKD